MAELIFSGLLGIWLSYAFASSCLTCLLWVLVFGGYLR